MSNTEFMPFPQDRVNHAEALENAQKPYQSPHHPNNKQRMAASGLTGDPTPGPLAHTHNTTSIQAPMIQVPPETSVVPNSDPEGLSLELPSRFYWYTFKDVYARPFKGRHLRKLVKAREEESTLHLAEAVSSVLSSTSGLQSVGFYLTPPDFFFTLYWLRINSFTKSAFIHNGICVNPEHLKMVESGAVPEDTLNHSEVIHKSTLKTIMLDEAPDPEAFQLDYPGAKLRVPLMIDAIQMTEHPNIASPDFAYAARLAGYLDTPQRTSLEQRVTIVDDLSGDDIQTIEMFEKATSNYGIIEKITWTCKTCGKSHTDDIELNTHNFFPSAA